MLSIEARQALEKCLSILKENTGLVEPSVHCIAEAITDVEHVLKCSVDEDRLKKLTARERECLSLIAQGLENKVIAERMGISYETVKEHVANIIRKVDSPNRTLAAVWAVKNGLA